MSVVQLRFLILKTGDISNSCIYTASKKSFLPLFKAVYVVMYWNYIIITYTKVCNIQLIRVRHDITISNAYLKRLKNVFLVL